MSLGASEVVYRAALRLLPADVRAQDGEPMLRAFHDLGAGRSPFARSLLLVRCLFRLLQVAALEHAERLADRVGVRELAAATAKDVVFAWRTLRRSPGFTAGAVLLLGLGIGATTSIFTLVDHILLRPLPYPAAERLLVLDEGSHTGPVFRGLGELPSVEMWAGAWADTANLTGEGEPLQLKTARVTEDFFALFGARAAHGRLLAPDDYEKADTVVLGHGLWTRLFGRDLTVIGEQIQLDGEPWKVVGVMDRRFTTPEALTGPEVDLYRPVSQAHEALQRHDTFVLEVAGRRVPGVGLADVNREVARLMERLDREAPNEYRDREGTLWTPATVSLSDVTVRGVRTSLHLLLGAVGLLLLIACANVGHLFLARGLTRGSEMAVRRSLGAGTGSLVRQLLVEGLVVAAAGGAVGVLVAAAAVRGLLQAIPDVVPREAAVVLDVRLLLFTAALSAGTVLLFALVPAMRTARGSSPGLAQRAATEGQGMGALRGGLVAVELAMAMMLLAGSSVPLSSFLEVTRQESGLVADDVWTVPLSMPAFEDGTTYTAAMEEIRRNLGALPEVERVSFGLAMPFTFSGGHRCCWRQRYTETPNADEGLVAMTHPVSSAYFETLGIPLVAGELWAPQEATTVPVPTVVTRGTAIEGFGSVAAALGQTLHTRRGAYVVRGVVEDHRHFGLDQSHEPTLFTPIEAIPFGEGMAELALKLRGRAPDGLAGAVRSAIWAAAPLQPIPEVRSLAARIDASTAARRFDSVLSGAFATVALLLTAGGLCGTLLYTVGRRRREMGIRLALGAGRFRVERDVLATALRVGAAGMALGLAGAWATSRTLESRLWGVEATDPRSFTAAAVLLLLTILLAGWLPARRAARIDPAETLRSD